MSVAVALLLFVAILLAAAVLTWAERRLLGPKALGDSWGLNPFRLPPNVRGAAMMADVAALRLIDLERLGDDVMLRYLV